MGKKTTMEKSCTGDQDMMDDPGHLATIRLIFLLPLSCFSTFQNFNDFIFT